MSGVPSETVSGTAGGVEHLPERAGTVIIGGGIVGLALARELAGAGVDTVVLERATLGAQQSRRAFGWVSNLGLDPRKLPLTLRTKALWQDIDERTGGATGYRRCGLLFACTTPGEETMWRDWVEETRGLPGVDARELEPAEAAERLRGHTSTVRYALLGPSDGSIEPERAVAAVAGLAIDAGVRVVERCTVHRVLREDGRACGVATARGNIACDDVVIAAGMHSRTLCSLLGVFLPQLGIESSLMRVSIDGRGPDVCLQHKGANLRPCDDGDYIVAPDHGHRAPITLASVRLLPRFAPAMWVTRGLLRITFNKRFFRELAASFSRRVGRLGGLFDDDEPTPDARLMHRTLASLARVAPDFGSARVKDIWVGTIDATPDSTPVISGVDAVPGLWLSTGFSGYGLTHAPAAGEALAAMIRGVEPSIDMSPYRLSRFTDGTRLTVRE